MLRLHKLQRARILKQQAQKITTKTQTFKNDFTEFKSFEVLSSKIADNQLTNVQSMRFKKLTVAVTADALLLNISLSFKLKIIKFEKMRTYKSQSENEH